ncbi:hypothetical protein ACVBEF_20765 [Glaciimonas sp. GG7]
MPGLQIITTNAGRAALINAEHNGTAPLTITEIGLTDAVFTADADMTDLPGEFKRINTLSGEVVAADTIHVTIRDDGTDTYTVRGIGYWLSNGVLLGIYSQPEAILEKSGQSMLLLSADTILTTLDVTSLTFGNANFTNPPATIERQGVVELATFEETVAGIDTTRAVTPAGLTPALAHSIAVHKTDADPHTQYLTSERGNALYFRMLAAYTDSDTDCDTLLDTGVREVSVANDRGNLDHTHLPTGCEGYGTLMTVVGGAFVRQVYSEGGIAQKTWERTGYLGETPPFKNRSWKLAWDTATFDPASKQDKLGFTPVQQGTGFGQESNVVKIGWSGTGVKVTVDQTDQGVIVFRDALEAALTNYLARTGGTVTGPIYAIGSTGPIGTQEWGRPGLQINAEEGEGHAAYMIFHRPGYTFLRFGLDVNNQLSLSAGTASYALWHAGNFNPADKISGSAGIRLDWSGRDGQPTWVYGGNDDPAASALYNPKSFHVSYADSAAKATNATNAGVAQTVINGADHMQFDWSDPGGQTLYVWGSDGAARARLSMVGNLRVGYANQAGSAPADGGTASYAHQLAGPGLQDGSIGSYRLNKNHNSSEVGGTWQIRGWTYDYGSGGDGNPGTRTTLWQRVG